VHETKPHQCIETHDKKNFILGEGGFTKEATKYPHATAPGQECLLLPCELLQFLDSKAVIKWMHVVGHFWKLYELQVCCLFQFDVKS
jgi:hypothetical protein